MLAKEGRAEISVGGGVFYNPEMEFCRDVSSLCFGSLGGKRLSVLDGMCATGIRGIRYSLENRNAGHVEFVDLSGKACRNARRNARKNGLKDFSVRKAEVCDLLFKERFDFVEVDPFGSPVPYLPFALRSLAMNGGGHLSVTATDVAVLCGAHHKACLKNYQARPLDNEYCHENASRILLGKIVRCGSENNLGIEPVVTLSKRHYIKVIARAVRGAEKAVKAVKSLGYVSHCPKCLWRGSSKLVLQERCRCGGTLQHAGPLWLGELHKRNVLKKMIGENGRRGYGKERELGTAMRRMACEVGMPPTYYDLHRVSKVLKVSAEKVENVIENLESMGHPAYRTHFKENSIKTNADIGDVKRALKGV